MSESRWVGVSIDNWKPKDKAEAIAARDNAIGALKGLHEHGFEHGGVALRNFVIDEESKKVRRAYQINQASKPELEIACVKKGFSQAFPQSFDQNECSCRCRMYFGYTNHGYTKRKIVYTKCDT
jgi:hypothetical protein